MKSLDQYCVVDVPLVVRITADSVYSNEIAFMSSLSILSRHMYARVIIEVIEGSMVLSRHSNLLIIDYKNKSVLHFEPGSEYIKNSASTEEDVKNSASIAEDVKKVISGMFEDWDGVGMKVETHTMTLNGSGKRNRTNRLPKIEILGGYCMAYVLKYAYFHKLGEPNTESSLADIRKFSRAVETIYGPLSKEGADIEFGSGTNKVIGGLAGAGLGYALLGPAGALLLGAGGVYAGSKVESKK